MSTINGKNVILECCITYGTFDIVMLWDTWTRWMTLKTLQNMWKICSLFVVHFVSTLCLLGLYVTCLPFACIYVYTLLGINFTYMLFHSSCIFFQRSSLLVRRSIWNWRCPRCRSTSFQRCSIGFMSGNCGLHGNVVIVWSLNHLIVNLLGCLGSLSWWNTHSFTYFFEFHNWHAHVVM